MHTSVVGDPCTMLRWCTLRRKGAGALGQGSWPHSGPGEESLRSRPCFLPSPSTFSGLGVAWAGQAREPGRDTKLSWRTQRADRRGRVHAAPTRPRTSGGRWWAMCPDGGSRDQLRSRMAPLPQPREAWIRPIPLLSHLKPCVRSLAGSFGCWWGSDLGGQGNWRHPCWAGPRCAKTAP